MPTLVSGGYTFTSIAVGYSHACAIGIGGTTYCWGRWRGGRVAVWQGGGVAGRQGGGVAGRRGGGVCAFKKAHLLANHVTLVRIGVAGDNAAGELGNGGKTSSSVPVVVQGSTVLNFTQVQAARYFSCGLSSTGAAWCWGDNTYVGGYTTYPYRQMNYPPPPGVDPTLGITFTQISATHDATTACAVTTTGDAYCWGNNAAGQIGVDFSSNTAYKQFSDLVLIYGGLNFTQITTAGASTCGVTISSDAFCWGYGIPSLCLHYVRLALHCWWQPGTPDPLQRLFTS